MIIRNIQTKKEIEVESERFYSLKKRHQALFLIVDKTDKTAPAPVIVTNQVVTVKNDAPKTGDGKTQTKNSKKKNG
jgi:hypothetical protein